MCESSLVKMNVESEGGNRDVITKVISILARVLLSQCGRPVIEYRLDCIFVVRIQNERTE